jgi:hypothetical protein
MPDVLQCDLARLVERATMADKTIPDTFMHVNAAVRATAATVRANRRWLDGGEASAHQPWFC